MLSAARQKNRPSVFLCLPTLIVLDEFHRAGAVQWGLGVQRLLAAYPSATILGLTATNVRYLDGQRDMAQELFDGHIASEMTLGEAIVRGILPAPKYVLSIFKYHPTHFHVLPALIRRFHEAKVEGKESVTCWGDGSPLREFMYVEDLANLCVFLMNNYSGNETVNAGTGKELTIKELTELVAKVVGYTGKIEWDTTKPNGTPRKLLDVSKAAALGWTYKTELEDGIRLSYEDFLHNPMRAER